jgi:hypothetical protein
MVKVPHPRGPPAITHIWHRQSTQYPRSQRLLLLSSSSITVALLFGRWHGMLMEAPTPSTTAIAGEVSTSPLTMVNAAPATDKLGNVSPAGSTGTMQFSDSAGSESGEEQNLRGIKTELESVPKQDAEKDRPPRGVRRVVGQHAARL